MKEKIEEKNTIGERAVKGKEVFEEIRILQRASRLNGIHPVYIIISPEKVENLVDYLMHEEKLSPITDSGTMRILGLEIIIDEKQILKLN